MVNALNEHFFVATFNSLNGDYPLVCLLFGAAWPHRRFKQVNAVVPAVQFVARAVRLAGQQVVGALRAPRRGAGARRLRAPRPRPHGDRDDGRRDRPLASQRRRRGRLLPSLPARLARGPRLSEAVLLLHCGKRFRTRVGNRFVAQRSFWGNILWRLAKLGVGGRSKTSSCALRSPCLRRQRRLPHHRWLRQGWPKAPMLPVGPHRLVLWDVQPAW